MSEDAFGLEAKEIPWWVVLLQGIAFLVLGFFLITASGLTTVVLVQVLGFYWLFSGILSIVLIFVDQSQWGWKLVVGILGILAGILVIQHPLWSGVLVTATVVLLIAIQGIIVGIIGLVQAFKGAGWGAGILGALSVLFGIILLLNPLLAASILPIVLGVLGIVGGIAAIVMAFRMK
jgi:uncharacterized membrane protein HdeD (DUF308 family)